MPHKVTTSSKSLNQPQRENQHQIQHQSQSQIQKTRPNRRKNPWTIRWLRWGFVLLNVVAPKWGARRAYRLWFTSPRFPEPPREQRWREAAHIEYLDHTYGPLAVYRWGQGPVVLLVHGWSGRGTQMGAFAAPLVARGFSVVAFDMPGHGRSAGKATDIFKAAAALAAVAQHVGSITAIVAHSFGTMVSTLAINDGLSVDKAVCLSAPTSLLCLVERFCHALGLKAKTEAMLKRMLVQEFGENVWQRTASDKQVADSGVVALIIHDKDDVDVPWSWSEQLSKSWPNSHLWLTHGLGHRRILRNREVLAAVSDFIARDKLPEDAITVHQPQTTPSNKFSIPL